MAAQVRGPRRGVGALAVCLACAGAALSVPAAAAADPAVPAALRLPASDPVLLRQLNAVAPRGRVLGAIAADVDRDGDADALVTTTDEIVAVWLNAGQGRFDRQPRPSRSRLGASPGIDDATGGPGVASALEGATGDPCLIERTPRLSPGRAPPARRLMDCSPSDRPRTTRSGRSPPPTLRLN